MIGKSRRTMVISGAAGLFLVLTIGIPYIPPPQTELPVEQLGVVPEGGRAQVCIGYNKQRDQWGIEWEMCPADHAFYGVDDPAGVKGPAKKINAVHACCPLPAGDILVEEHVFVHEECPQDYVATGSRHSGQGEEMEHMLRCTKINTGRYQLSEEKPSVYWGDGSAGWQGSVRIDWNNIPAGIRYSNGRQAQDKWDIDGCVGYPWGSLLAKKSTKYCSGMYFKQLQFSGRTGDPAPGTPVRMFAVCDEVENVRDPEGYRCRQAAPGRDKAA